MQTTFAEKISGYEGERRYKTGRMSELMSASSEESRSLNDTEQKEFDDLKVEVEAIDKQVSNLRTHEKLLLTATPVDGDADTATRQRTEAGRPSSIIFQRQNAFPGQAFAKLAMAVMVGKGSRSDTEMLIRDHCKDMPQVMAAYKSLAYDKINKAAVAAGTTTDSNWAAPLVNYQDLASEFIELLRPETIIGRLPLLRRIPFNVRMPKIASGVSAQWVGQGLAKPVQAMDFDSVTHLFHKLAVIVVLTEELMKFSNPAAEQVVRDEIVAAVAQKKDTSFIDPSLAAVGTTSPASITNGLSNIGNPGTSLASITAALTTAIANVATANINMSSGAWVMRPQTAVYLSTLLTTQDNRAFPGMSLQGGTLFGFPVVVSGNMVADTGSSGFIVFMIQREIFISDDGATRIDASGEASVQMDSAPSAGAQSLVSLWQNNMVGLKAEQFTTWTRRRDAAVQVIEDVSF
jgi:HK97 family phage major capsid protein